MTPSSSPRSGSLLVPMIEALDERGPDSSGIALYADRRSDRAAPGRPGVLRLSLGADVAVDWDGGRLRPARPVRRPGPTSSASAPGSCVDVPEAARAEAYAAAGRSSGPRCGCSGPDATSGCSRTPGRPTETCARYGVARWEGYLAVAHTRMATESAVTVLHSHPFVPDPGPVRRAQRLVLELRHRPAPPDGPRASTFDSDNDSEVGARFLARRLAAGDDLEEATRWVMKEMDGFFTLVITTAEEMSVVRDAFACKPAVVAETDRATWPWPPSTGPWPSFPGSPTAEVFEPQPEEVYTWSR